jgi:hypothetical protein
MSGDAKIVAGKIKQFLPDGLIVEPYREDLPRELKLTITAETSLDGDPLNYINITENNVVQAVVDDEFNMLRVKLWYDRSEDDEQ